jgi:hypothetical protein
MDPPKALQGRAEGILILFSIPSPRCALVAPSNDQLVSTALASHPRRGGRGNNKNPHIKTGKQIAYFSINEHNIFLAVIAESGYDNGNYLEPVRPFSFSR